MEIKGKITEVSETLRGETKDGKGWSKLSFLVETTEDYNNKYYFDIFEMDDAEKNKVKNFDRFNNVGDDVNVSFNIKTSDKFNGKRYVSLQAWKVFKADKPQEIPQMGGTTEALNALPF